ncbi:MAG: exonuclease SbcCD subunit D C-terminal domain-containing protein [Nitrosomonas sp.]|jgi:exonuclease SbcD|nr:exonuclease SbcCD subunit D C-terminal domain-containing protein [Nitrosomonas sp.]
MKILHTSDWHLGRALYGRKRHAEFEHFLDWLLKTIVQEQVDMLLVAGDVFDTGTPGNTAQAMYYRFLHRVAASCCRHVVIIAGNHDSPSFLNAPKELLKALDVHVVGSPAEGLGDAWGDELRDELLILRDAPGNPEMIVCAVPYLRDRDIRTAEAGESIADKERKLIEGIRNHYAGIVSLARQKRAALDVDIPMVAMGHLFTAGGKTIEGDGVRELYVGSLAHVAANIFPDDLAYVALGHLHVPQQVGDSCNVRYSGSPLPMGFGEAGQQKNVVIVEFFSPETASGAQSNEQTAGWRERSLIKLIPVPVFQKLERVQGDLALILNRIRELAENNTQAWLEVIYDGDAVTPAGDLRQSLDDAVNGTQLDILCVKNSRAMNRVLHRVCDRETLDDLNVKDVFARCLAAHDVPPAQQPELIAAYDEIVHALYATD